MAVIVALIVHSLTMAVIADVCAWWVPICSGSRAV